MTAEHHVSTRKTQRTVKGRETDPTTLISIRLPRAALSILEGGAR